MEYLYNFFIQNKFVFSMVVALFALAIFIFLVRKYKLTKYQMLIFGLFTIFWMSIVVIRSYRKIYMISTPEVGGLGIDQLLAVTVTASYGLISIFVRLPIFAISDYFKKRKIFILLSIFFIGLSSFITFISPNYTTMLCSSISIGIGASFISLFNVMFAETFTKENAIKSVSILSIAPLFGEFISAPIQYIFTNGVVKQYNMLWLISGILAIIAFICCLFFKDNKEKVRNFTFKKFMTILKNKKFLVICLLGVVVSFIKFGTSGANYLSIVKLSPINMDALGLAYSDVIFSLFQLIAGVIAGLYLKKKIGVKKTLLLGLTSSLIFTVLMYKSNDPIVLFLSYSLNGFGYGLTYNILIGLAMQPFTKDYREISMSIYQTFFAIGIYYGDKIYAIIFNVFKNIELLTVYKNVFGVISIVTVITIILIIILYKGKDNKFLED